MANRMNKVLKVRKLGTRATRTMNLASSFEDQARSRYLPP